MNGEDIKLDKAQRARAVDLEPQVIDDPEWACAAIVWQRDQLADRDAEIVNLRARLDAEASHRLSLCADNERFIAEIEMLKRRIDAQHAANGELAVDLKEWRIRFPSNDPQIARRMVEDRAVAEANMDNAGLLAEIERLRAELTQRCAECESAKRFGHRIDIAGALLTKAEAERDRAREVAVWAVRHCIGMIRNGASIVNDDYTVEVEHDGTDAGILAALEEAMGRE